MSHLYSNQLVLSQTTLKKRLPPFTDFLGSIKSNESLTMKLSCFTEASFLLFSLGKYEDAISSHYLFARCKPDPFK